MALTTITAKSNVFLTLEDVRDWLKIPADATTKDPNINNRLQRIINQVTDMAERYVQGPIKTREIPEEFHDGDSSNTIVPDFYPVRTITAIHVDFNRAFTTPTLIDPSNYILRGAPDSTFPSQVRGTDIVLRDDNSNSIIGRIFTGSTAGSIKLQYTAGWGADQSELPGDLVSAILMGIEFYYMLRESRDLNVKGKSVNGQSISRVQGLPKEVTDILDTYVDHTFGRNNMMQKNTFVL